MSLEKSKALSVAPFAGQEASGTCSLLAKSSNNILCGKCGEIIHAEPSDVIHQLVEDIVVPVVDPLMVDIECAIAELSHTADMYADAKKKFKALNKQLKYRIKVELRTATII